jgi:hypothetical protein
MTADLLQGITTTCLYLAVKYMRILYKTDLVIFMHVRYYSITTITHKYNAERDITPSPVTIKADVDNDDDAIFP